jgi:hypothetical protein
LFAKTLPRPPTIFANPRGRKQGDQKTRKKSPNFSKNIPKSCKVKKGQNIYNKAQFESPKHLHQTAFETLKYLQQTMF